MCTSYVDFSSSLPTVPTSPPPFPLLFFFFTSTHLLIIFHSLHTHHLLSGLAFQFYAITVAHFQAICDFKYKRSSRILGFNFLIFDLPKLNYRTILSYSCPPTHRLSVGPHPPNLNLNNIHFPTYPHPRPHPPSSSSTLPLCHSATSLHLFCTSLQLLQGSATESIILKNGSSRRVVITHLFSSTWLVPTCT